MEKNHQAEILETMMQADFYPHPVETIERRETHISTVFLTGPFVYKIKKPVDLGFLDFTSLEKRQHYCLQEIALNRRLSHGVYIDAVPITCHDGTYALNGSGETVEFAVKMHQLAETDSMQQRLKRATLDDGDIESLVRLLVGFFAQTATIDDVDPSGTLAWEENLQRAEPFAGVWIDRRQFEFVRSAARSFYRRHQNLFQRRRRDGKIKDGHGDLRTDHIYFTTTGIQIIDCIEFNDTLRVLDIISDLAFLVMDLEYNHFPETARSLIRWYVKQTDDVGALPLLDFYRCYRAMVRCKVSCFRLRECGDRSADRDMLQGGCRTLSGHGPWLCHRLQPTDPVGGVRPARLGEKHHRRRAGSGRRRQCDPLGCDPQGTVCRVQPHHPIQMHLDRECTLPLPARPPTNGCSPWPRRISKRGKAW